MFQRLLKPLESHSFFLFGARGTGKSTLIHELLTSSKAQYIDLLDSRIYDEYLHYPGILIERFQKYSPEWIVIDEVQRLPNLLNDVHKLILKKNRNLFLQVQAQES